MKKYIGLLILAVLIAGFAVAIGGCGGETTESGIDTPQGVVNYVKDANEVTIAGKKGEDVWTVAKVTEKELGVPFPPGAKVDEMNSGKLETTIDGNKEVWSAVTLTSDKSVSEITEWYKGELSGQEGFEDQSVKTDESQVGLFTVGSGDTLKSVLITSGKGNDPNSSVITVVSREGSGGE